MTNSDQLPPSPFSRPRSSPGGLQHRLHRNRQGRWIEGTRPEPLGPLSDVESDPVTLRFGDWAVSTGPAGQGVDRPGSGLSFPATPPTEDATWDDRFGGPSSRRINDTTFPLRRTDSHGDNGRSAPIAGPFGPGPGRSPRTDAGHDRRVAEGDYQPIEESWSREWVERAGGDPYRGTGSGAGAGPETGSPGGGVDRDPFPGGVADRDPFPGGVADHRPVPHRRGGLDDDLDDGLEAFGADGRSFDEEELETGAAARRNAIEWAVVLVAATLLALVLRAVLLQAFYIPSPSMEDTLLIRDRVLVNKISYRLHDINRGDIVVFNRTAAELELAGPDEPKDVIKRVIALPGETIEIRGNQVLIDGQVLLEPYLNDTASMPDFGPEVVPEDHIFVMGDNRNLSSDSRGELGPIETDRVVGRAFFLFWPLDRLSLL